MLPRLPLVVRLHVSALAHTYNSKSSAVSRGIEIFAGIVSYIKADARFGGRLTEDTHNGVHLVVSHGNGLAHSTLAREQLCGQFLAQDALPVCSQHQCSFNGFQRIDLREVGIYADGLRIEPLSILKHNRKHGSYMYVRPAFYVALVLYRRDKLFLVIGVEGWCCNPFITPFFTLHAADVGAVQVRHPVVDGPLLIKVAADDDRAAKGDDKAQERKGSVALHAGNKSECLFH